MRVVPSVRSRPSLTAPVYPSRDTLRKTSAPRSRTTPNRPSESVSARASGSPSPPSSSTVTSSRGARVSLATTVPTSPGRRAPGTRGSVTTGRSVRSALTKLPGSARASTTCDSASPRRATSRATPSGTSHSTNPPYWSDVSAKVRPSASRVPSASTVAPPARDPFRV